MLPLPYLALTSAYHVYHSCPAQHHALVIKARGAGYLVLVTSTRGGLQTSCPLHLGIGVAKESTAWSTLDGIMLYSHRDKAKSASVLYSDPLWLMPPRSLQPFGLCVPLSFAAEGPWPERYRYAWGSLTYPLKQNKGTGTLLGPETGKDIPKQGSKPGTACMNSLFPGKEVFQAPGSSYAVELGFERLQVWGCHSQHFFIGITWLNVFLPSGLCVPQGQWPGQCLMYSECSVNASWLKKGKNEGWVSEAVNRSLIRGWI